MLGLLAIVLLFFGAHSQTEVITKLSSQGYTASTISLTTSDGYTLNVHRMNNASLTNSTRKPVFLMHGLLFASTSFVYAGSKYGIAYNLADAGYDVWMGNARGNNYSHYHTTMDADADTDKFFDFSYEEIAMIDLPTMIDYILTTTNQDKLHYIGHSMGGTTFYVLNSMNTTYQSKFASAHLLAGLGYTANFPNPNILALSNATDVIYNALVTTKELEMRPVGFTASFLEILLNTTIPDSLDAGASVKVVTHFCQNIRDKAFRRWNYGSAGNLQKYGSASPPAYNLSAINVGVTLHYSVNDSTQSEADVLEMAKALPKGKVHKITRSSFSNLDYITSTDTKDLVTSFIIKSLNNY